ncbi:MAG: polysaccharide pyruvyl transferase family protein [Solirubrobacterales bacterium]|nr:polysaccharide pyruvyl transferase family protein [Solirubrobacterales bacterium]
MGDDTTPSAGSKKAPESALVSGRCAREVDVLICSAAVQTEDGIALNLGDEAISECLERGVRRALGPNSVVLRTINVRRSGEAPGVGRVSTSVWSLHSAMRRSKVAALGGGTLIQNDKGLALYCLKVAVISMLTRTPLVICAIGVERVPVHLRPFYWFAVRRARNVTVRDGGSLELLASWSACEATVSADPLFLPEALDDLGPAANPKFDLALSLRPDASTALVGSLVGAIRSLKVKSLLAVPTDRRPHADEQELRGFFADADAPWAQVSRESSWTDAMREIACARVLIGMRLHACIFASLVGTPAVVVRTENKTAALADELGLSSVPLTASADQIASAIGSAVPPDQAVLGALGARAEVAIDQITALVRTA